VSVPETAPPFRAVSPVTWKLSLRYGVQSKWPRPARCCRSPWQLSRREADLTDKTRNMACCDQLPSRSNSRRTGLLHLDLYELLQQHGAEVLRLSNQLEVTCS
jgi:hypothetical protein